jgi:hypothetical protein
MNSSGGVPNGTRTVLVFGAVNISYENDTRNPRLAYNESDTADFVFAAVSYGPENGTVLNDTYNWTLNATFTPPSGTSFDRVALYNGSTWNASESLFTYGPGEWNTSARGVAQFFYPIEYTLRNFSVFGFMNVFAFDSEEYWNGSIYANELGHYFANVTNSTNGTLLGAECTAEFFDRNVTLPYNATTDLYSNSSAFSLEGVVPYTVTCIKQYYNTNSSTANASIHSAVNVSLAWNVTELSAGVRMIVLNVTNHQNYTEHDIFAHGFVPSAFGATYEQAPILTATMPLSNEYAGTSARWYIPNITAGSTTRLNFTVTGTDNSTQLFLGGVSALTQNTSIVLS